jgi:hypothetical protein
MSPFLRLPRQECWRGQVVDVIIRVPRGKFIHFDSGIKELNPFRYYFLNSAEGSAFRMSETGLEPVSAVTTASPSP